MRAYSYKAIHSILMCVIVLSLFVSCKSQLSEVNDNMEMQFFNGIVVDVNYSSERLTIYTEDLKTSKIVTIYVYDEVYDINHLEVYQNIHVGYVEPFIEIAPPYSIATYISLNSPSTNDKINKAIIFFDDYKSNILEEQQSIVD